MCVFFVVVVSANVCFEYFNEVFFVLYVFLYIVQLNLNAARFVLIVDGLNLVFILFLQNNLT